MAECAQHDGEHVDGKVQREGGVVLDRQQYVQHARRQSQVAYRQDNLRDSKAGRAAAEFASALS